MIRNNAPSPPHNIHLLSLPSQPLGCIPLLIRLSSLHPHRLQHPSLLPQERLRILRLNLHHRVIPLPLRNLQPDTRMRHPLLIPPHRRRCAPRNPVLPTLPVPPFLLRRERPLLLYVLQPPAAHALDVEALLHDADLAPRVPVGCDEDLVAVDDVWVEGLALY